MAAHLRDGNLDEAHAADCGLRSVFDLSYQGLDDTARRVFRLLGLFPGESFTAPIVAAMAELPAAASVDGRRAVGEPAPATLKSR